MEPECPAVRPQRPLGINPGRPWSFPRERDRAGAAVRIADQASSRKPPDRTRASVRGGTACLAGSRLAKHIAIRMRKPPGCGRRISHFASHIAQSIATAVSAPKMRANKFARSARATKQQTRANMASRLSWRILDSITRLSRPPKERQTMMGHDRRRPIFRALGAASDGAWR
jgi:hypothetical protein